MSLPTTKVGAGSAHVIDGRKDVRVEHVSRKIHTTNPYKDKRSKEEKKKKRPSRHKTKKPQKQAYFVSNKVILQGRGGNAMEMGGDPGGLRRSRKVTEPAHETVVDTLPGEASWSDSREEEKAAL